MGAIISVKSVDFSSRAVGYYPPIPDALYWNYFDNSNHLDRNLIVGQSDGTRVGNPEMGAGFAKFQSQSAFVQTPLLDMTEGTLLAVSRPGPENNQYKWAISSYYEADGTLHIGSCLGYDNTASSTPFAATGRNNNGVDTPLLYKTNPPQNPNLFAFTVARFGNTRNRVDDLTRNSAADQAVSFPRFASNGQYYCIGSGVSLSGSGSIDVAFGAIIPRIITDDDMLKVYAVVKAQMAARGITV